MKIVIEGKVVAVETNTEGRLEVRVAHNGSEGQTFGIQVPESMFTLDPQGQTGKKLYVGRPVEFTLEAK